MKVIVAGAGLSGLVAARALARDGAAVTVMEARTRAGGRVWTLRGALRGGQHAELGGEFIDGDHDDMSRLCRELSLPLVRVLQAGFTHRFRGNDGEYHVSRTRPWTELESLLAPLLRRYRGANGDPTSDAVREIATWSVRQWLQSRGASREQHAMADALRGFFLADPDELSVLPLVAQLAQGGSPAQAKMCRIEGGADRLVDALVHDTPARLLLGHRITAVAQAADRVTVTAIDEHGHQQQLEADAAVITLPASALASVSITPALPEAQWRAITTLKYGCATKVVVQLSRPPFRARARAFATDTPLGAFWDSTEGQGGEDKSQIPNPHSQQGHRHSHHVLTFLAGGAASRTLRARADRGPHAVLSDLCWLGLANAPVDAFHAVTWEDDPFARGGYAYLDPGFDPALGPQLARRSGRLVFAGEHTSERWQGYMNGAVESGLRAARELGDDRSS
jgi:monoamine oxidase